MIAETKMRIMTFVDVDIRHQITWLWMLYSVISILICKVHIF